ncbi:unnamed protein product [Pleuronectes platessa]|uniref:Uncharacterized protein n=1 Tax=Pleuronectes platessa TaxID=8262 RepID=A0A9N7UJ07_PLEPL|nr:unnamed protein product [Pleuronectes platessa]
MLHLKAEVSCGPVVEDTLPSIASGLELKKKKKNSRRTSADEMKHPGASGGQCPLADDSSESPTPTSDSPCGVVNFSIFEQQQVALAALALHLKLYLALLFHSAGLHHPSPLLLSQLIHLHTEGPLSLTV